MKILLLAIALIMLPLCAFAAGPYLVCDPYPASAVQPTGFTCTFDALAPTPIPISTNADGSVQMHFDLAALNLTNGNHTVKCSAQDAWGSSGDSAPFAFTKGVPSPPANIRLQLN